MDLGLRRDDGISGRAGMSGRIIGVIGGRKRVGWVERSGTHRFASEQLLMGFALLNPSYRSTTAAH